MPFEMVGGDVAMCDHIEVFMIHLAVDSSNFVAARASDKALKETLWKAPSMYGKISSWGAPIEILR